MKRKLVCVLLCVAMLTTLFAGCGKKEEAKDDKNVEVSGGNDSSKDKEESKDSGNKDSGESKGKVYYLNFKPEVNDQWQEIAARYTELTGVPVSVVTAASGTYEETLKSEIAKSDAPTLFQINGPVGYASWKDYCLDLTGTDLYNFLSDKSLAVTGEDGKAYGIPFTIEGYGIIYNNSIMEKYFATSNAVVTSMDEINNFDTLKAVVEDMTSKKAELNIEGVFASTSLTPGEDWRWHTHLANMPVYYEYKEKGITDSDAVEFTYSQNYKNIFDLYINNSITAPKLLGSKIVDDSMAEFALGKVAMVQNGNWAWGQISGTEGSVVKEEDIKFMPIYTGVEGEENQGLCIGTENFWCVNSKASADDQKATLDFLTWLINSEEGKDYMVNKLGNTASFTTFSDAEKPKDPLAKSMLNSMESGKLSVSWDFKTFPSEQFKADLGEALLEYSAGNQDWSYVESVFVTRWAEEAKLTQ